LLVKPKVMVALGSTAALAITGNGADIVKRRGTFELAGDGVTPVFVTIHPSSVLRAGSAAQQDQARTDMVADFVVLKQVLDERTKV